MNYGKQVIYLVYELKLMLKNLIIIVSIAEDEKWHNVFSKLQWQREWGRGWRGLNKKPHDTTL